MGKKNWLKLLVGIGLLSIVVVVCTLFVYKKMNENNYMDRINNMNNHSQASMVYAASTVDDLVGLSDIIVEGKVVDYEAVNHGYGVIFTHEMVEVKKAIKGNISEGNKVTVVVTGGDLNGNMSPTIKNCPIIDKRGNYMLFLKTENEGKTYFIIGGNNGFGLIKNNKVEVTGDDVMAEIIKNYSVDDLEKYINDR